MGFMERVYREAKRRDATIILAEAEDPRILKAAAIIEKQRLAKLILLGDEKKIRRLLARLRLRLKAQLLSFENYPRAEQLSREMVLLRRHKGLVLDEARTILSGDTKYFAAMLVKMGVAQGYVSGNRCPTAETIRPALQLLQAHTGFASSYFVMLHKGKAFLFADCALNVEPTAEQLAEIGVQTAQSAKLYGIQPRVAFLSFSTRGSAQHERVEKVKQAVQLAKERLRGVPVDGELQFDAAFDPGVGRIKAKGSPVAGKATVFVFPGLESGNIGYKICQRMAGATAIGPIVQGLKAPANDLSRGCSVQDIIDVVAITAMQVGR